MVKLHSDSKRLKVLNLTGFVCMSYAVWLAFGLISSLLYIAIVSNIAAFVIVVHKCLKAKNKEEKKMKQLSEQRLLLLKRLIDHAYTYKCDKTLFYKRFCEEVNVITMRKNRLIEMSLYRDYTQLYAHTLSNGRSKKTLKEDIEFLFFINEGFTPRELSVIYNLNHPHSIYVKRNRLKVRINRLSKRRNDVVIPELMPTQRIQKSEIH